MKPSYRNNSLYFSDETLFYVKLEAKRLAGECTEAAFTFDQVANGLVREVLTTRNPEWCEKWVRMEAAKQESKKRYQEIESL